MDRGGLIAVSIILLMCLGFLVAFLYVSTSATYSSLEGEPSPPEGQPPPEQPPSENVGFSGSMYVKVIVEYGGNETEITALGLTPLGFIYEVPGLGEVDPSSTYVHVVVGLQYSCAGMESLSMSVSITEPEGVYLPAKVIMLDSSDGTHEYESDRITIGTLRYLLGLISGPGTYNVKVSGIVTVSGKGSDGYAYSTSKEFKATIEVEISQVSETIFVIQSIRVSLDYSTGATASIVDLARAVGL